MSLCLPKLSITVSCGFTLALDTLKALLFQIPRGALSILRGGGGGDKCPG